MILHSEIVGDGEPIVFLHTGLQTGLTDFETQREFFKNDRRVILPDLRGHGKSRSNQLNNFLEDSVEDLKETFEELGVDRPHMVGCSIGGLVALAYAKRYDVKSLTVSGIISDKPSNWTEQHSEDVQHQKGLLENQEIVDYFNELHESDWQEFLYLAKNEDWYPFELTKDLSTIQKPILFMVGDGNVHEVNTASKYKEMNANVHVCVLPFASHLVHSQQPNSYTQILCEFLDTVSGESKG